MFDYGNAGYIDVLKDADSCCISFDCTWPCKFLETLEYDHPEVFAVVNTSVYNRSKGTGHLIDACTDKIFIPSTNSYGMIHIKKYEGEKFGVSIEIRPSSFINSDTKDVAKGFMSAASKMG